MAYITKIPSGHSSAGFLLQLKIITNGRQQHKNNHEADRLAGIEILDAMKRLDDPEIFKQVIIENIALGEIRT